MTVYFETLKKELAPDVPSLRTLCPTRWTVKASSLESILNNSYVFQALWEEAKEIAQIPKHVLALLE